MKPIRRRKEYSVDIPEIGRSSLIGVRGVWVGVGWGDHPTLHKDGFICVSVAATKDSWIVFVSGGPGPINKKHAVGLLETPMIGEDCAHLAERNISRQTSPEGPGMSFEEIKRITTETTPIIEEWHWKDPQSKETR